MRFHDCVHFMSFRFKENFETVSSTNINELDIPLIPMQYNEKQKDIINLCKDMLKEDFIREDYKEVVTLTLLVLKDEDTNFTGFKRPGALHKARWMAKILYCIKIVLLDTKIMEFAKGKIVSTTQMKKLKQFVQFVIYCYIPWWLTAPVSSAAPSNDLKLANSFIEYRSENSIVSKAALTALNRHMWYLSEELTPLSLFSHNIDISQKKKMVEKLHQYAGLKGETKRYGTGYGKPFFPNVPDQINNDLSIYIGKDSWIFF